MIPYGAEQGEHTAENDALRRAIERLAERYENTSRDTWSRPDVVADNLRRILDETRVIPPASTAPERDRAAEVEAAEDRAEQAAFDAARERS